MDTGSILIVDDDKNFRKTLTDILTSKGYTPAATGTGAAALDQINREKPAVALIDLKLEDMPGLELMQHIKTHSPGTECIVLTGYASQASAINAVNLGAYGYLQKPYDMEQLLVTIRRAVEKWETQETLKKLRRRNELLLNAAGEGILGLDLQGRHTFVNPAAASMLGYTIEELVDQDSHSIWHHSRPNGEPYPKNECPIHRSAPDQPTYGSGEEVFWRKNETCFPVEYVSTPIQEGDRPVGAVVVFRDISDHQQREQENAQLYAQVRSSHERLEILSRQLLEVQETERRFLARELHDDIGQTLTMVKINLQMMQQALDPAAPSPYLEKGINTVDRAIQHVRNLSLDLRPSLLDDLGLVPTLRWYVDRQAQETGIRMQFTAPLLAKRPPPDLEIACFRLVQEALTNVIRHAQARHVEVELSQPDHELSLTIRDDGVGFDVQTVLERAAQGTGLGLLGMQERVLFTGGRIKINSTPNQGTEIQVVLPIPSSKPDHKTRKEA